jgi:hypothetical protein
VGPGERRSGGERAVDLAAGLMHLVGRGVGYATKPVRRRWESDDPLDGYTLVHMSSVAGDSLVGIALADSVFFSLPVGQAKIRVALYLGLTMAPLAFAAPVLVPLLDRGGFRRLIAFGAGAGRAAAAVFAAPRFDTLLLFPVAFVLLVLTKVHTVTKNGLTMAYAPSEDGLVQANARMSRLAVVSAVVAVGPGLLLLWLGGAQGVLYLAAVAYTATALLTLRLPQPAERRVHGVVGARGRMPSLANPAAATAGLRAASGFLMFLLAFALRRSGQPAYWFGLLIVAGMTGAFLGDVIAPRISERLRDEATVLAALFTAGTAGAVAFAAFDLPILMAFAALAGASTEFGRLAFQSLMQRSAPGGAHGRVFVRYEVAFQLAWVCGAFVPAILPIEFRPGILLLALFYLVLGAWFLVWPRLQARPEEMPG